MVPGYLKIWLFFSLLNLCELRIFLRKTAGKVELVTLTGNDFSLLDSQRETYLKELKREEENNYESESKELVKLNVNDYSLFDSQRKKYLEELKIEEEKYNESGFKHNFEINSDPNLKTQRPVRTKPTRKSNKRSRPITTTEKLKPPRHGRCKMVSGSCQIVPGGCKIVPGRCQIVSGRCHMVSERC